MSITSNKAWHQSQIFSRDCAIEYTSEMSWRDSYKMLDFIYDGGWKLHDDEREYTDWDNMILPNAQYWDMMDVFLPKGMWKIK